MPITFNCPCGKVLRIADESAGKRIKCPACQAVGTAPGGAAPAAPKFELVEDEPPKPAAKPKPAAAKPAAKPAKDEDDGGFEVVEEDEKPKAKKPALKKGARRDEDDGDDEEEEKPKKKKKPRRDDDDEEPRARRRSGDPDAGKKIMYLIGGLVLTLVGIGIAVYWWNSGPHTGRRPYSGYIFGACCVVVGLGTAVKGITGNFGEDE